MSIVFEGPEGVALYRAVALKAALGLYAKSGMRPNRAWTPRAMIAAASGITGLSYPVSRKGAATAHDDLAAVLDAMREPKP